MALFPSIISKGLPIQSTHEATTTCASVLRANLARIKQENKTRSVTGITDLENQELN
jgi:hypothetical protein